MWAAPAAAPVKPPSAMGASMTRFPPKYSRNPARHLEGPTVDPDVLPDEEDPVIGHHLLEKAFADGLQKSHRLASLRLREVFGLHRGNDGARFVLRGHVTNLGSSTRGLGSGVRIAAPWGERHLPLTATSEGSDEDIRYASRRTRRPTRVGRKTGPGQLLLPSPPGGSATSTGSAGASPL